MGVKFVATQDLHLSIRNPVSRTDSYYDAIFQKLDQVLRLAIKVKASAILLAGDIFNDDYKSRVPVPLLYRTLSWCLSAKDSGIRVIGIPGNHDLLHNRYDSLPGQALGVLFRAKAIEDVSFSSVDVDGVSVSGIPYPAARDLSAYNSLPIPSDANGILLAHCFATADGGEYFGEAILPYRSFTSFPFGVFIFGHDHRDNGIYRIDNKLFVNIGALSRGSISQDNIDRVIKVALLDRTDNLWTVQQVKLFYRPANEVFDLVLREQKKREQAAIEQFVDQLSDNLSDLGAVSFRDRLSSMDLPEKVRQRVFEYIDSAESSS